MKATLESLLEGQNLTENDAHRAMGWMADETV